MTLSSGASLLHYRVVEKIGEGGMGAVWKARPFHPTTLVRDVEIMAGYSAATRDHSSILIRVSPDAAKDKGEIRLLFGWQDAFGRSNH